MKNLLIFALFLFVFFVSGCANLNNSKTEGVAQFPVQTRKTTYPTEVEEAFYVLDEPLACFYFLVRQYEKGIGEYANLIKEKKETEESALIGLLKCFLLQEKFFRERWREIYNNPDTAKKEAEKFLQEIDREIIVIKETLDILENILREIKQKNVLI